MGMTLVEWLEHILDRLDGHRRDINALNAELRDLREELKTEQRRRLGYLGRERAVKKGEK